jgi:hypothetical protein
LDSELRVHFFATIWMQLRGHLNQVTSFLLPVIDIPENMHSGLARFKVDLLRYTPLAESKTETIVAEPVMNEATFESRLASVLERLFPGPFLSEIETQPTFTVRLGHRTFAVNGLDSLARGRGDVIVNLDGKSVLMLELKAPSTELTDVDLRQVLSYARLHEPMIPIVGVTNGATIRLHSTFDGASIEGETLNEQKLARLLEAGARRAAWSRDEAIRNLVGGDPAVWAAALRAQTDHVLEDLDGSIDDLTRPLSKDFRLPRRATVMLAGAFVIDKERALALVGPPLSGKTNVIAELCRRSEEFKIAPLYVDCTESSDLLEEISRALTDSLSASIPRDQVYDWLRLGIGAEDEERPRVVLILDSLFPEDSKELMKQATQLLANVGANFSVLYALTDGDWDRVRSVPGRFTMSKLGRHAKAVILEELTDDEVDLAREYLVDSLRILLPEPSQFDLTLRQPHTLRLFIGARDFSEKMPEGVVAVLPPVVLSWFLLALWKRTEKIAELRADYGALARCYAKDEPTRRDNVHLGAVSAGVGTMSLKTVEAELSESIFTRLLVQGHVKRVTASHSVVIVPAVPELLSAASVGVLTEMLLTLGRSDGASAAKEALLRWTRGLALGDRVAALVLTNLSSEDPELLLEIFHLLMADEPREEIKESGTFLVPIPGDEVIELTYDSDSVRFRLPDGTEKEVDWPEDEGPMRLMTDTHSWNILSHLAYSDIRLETPDGIAPLGPVIIMRVGKVRAFLRDVGRPSLLCRASVHEHTLPNYGSVPCLGHGATEPITYAIQFNMHKYGECMDGLVDAAIEDGDPALLLRLYAAAITLKGIKDKDVRTRVSKMAKRLRRALDWVFDAMSNDHGESGGSAESRSPETRSS